ncbi:hypothetical protein SAY86_003520 [Trapa natans]|uniref:Uncharacterized protein n=1 Tax=Trapa natans TaxID=22666 RepID=A0AAN7RPC4_TRANT|nr:hypothetical protein SAY86_003520 [Trapa natans]
MAPKNDGTVKKGMNKGAWTAEEDRKLSQYIELHGPKRWKTIAIKAEEEETPSTAQISPSPPKKAPLPLDHPTVTHEITKGSPHKTLPVTDDNIDVNELFDFTTGGSYGLDWVNKFLELDEGAWINEKSKWGRGL